MHKAKIAIGAAVLALALAACDVTPGGSCSQEGSTNTNKDGTTYECKSLVNPDGTPGKRIWQLDNDAPLTPDRP